MPDENPNLPAPGETPSKHRDRERAKATVATDRSERDPPKDIQGGTTAAQPSSPQLGERTADMDARERGGMASTEGQTGSEGGLGSAERSMNQERSRGGQMGPGGGER